MSDPEATGRLAMEAGLATLRAIDAALSTLVIARDSVTAHLRELQGLLDPAPTQATTMGEPVPEGCQHPEHERLDLPRGQQLCQACGEQVDP